MDIILLGHGSRRGRDTELGLQEIKRRLKERMPNGQRVRMAGWEFTPPSLKESALELVKEGSRDIVVMPFFLFRGKHLKEEIPLEIQRLKACMPGVSIGLCANLGLDSRLLDMVEERIKAPLLHTKSQRIKAEKVDKAEKATGIVLVRRGSRPEYDPGEDLFQLTKSLSHRLGLPVKPAQAQFGQPSLEKAIKSLVNSSLRSIIVMPYLLFPGKVLYDNVIAEIEKARSLYPSVNFFITPTLGVDDRLIDIALDRIKGKSKS